MAQTRIPTRKISSPFMIGVFVLSGLALLVGLTLWLGAIRLFKEYNFYTTYFNSSVQGLEAGQPVKYQGVPIGNIQNLRVASDGKLIEVNFRLDKKIVIHDSMRIRIEMASIAGSKYLLLFYPDTPHQLYQYPDISALTPEHPVVRSAPSAIEEMRVSLNEAINNVLAIDTRGISLQSIRTLRSIAQLMENPELFQTVHNLNRTSNALSKILGAADTAKIVSDVDRIVGDVEVTSKNMIAISETLLKTSQKLDEIAARLSSDIEKLDISRRAEQVVTRYDSTMTAITRSATSLGRRTEASLDDVRGLVQELKATSRDFRRSARMLNDNPGQLLLGEPLPKEK
jgi:ABC-type transporter Mla subunit MlaD